MTRVVLHSDGGARGNPGPAAIGVVVGAGPAGGGEVLAEIGEKVGVATNNVAEYLALIRGLEECARLGATEVDSRLDSQLVVEQMNGRYRVKHQNVVDLHRRAKELASGFAKVTFTHVPRAQNAGADALVNAALDGRLGELGATAAPGGVSAAPADAEADLHRSALELIREAYYAAADMAAADLDAVNRSRPPGMRYQSRKQLVRDFLQMAGAVSTFATRMGLVDQGELTEFLREFWVEQPDLVDQEDESWIQQKLDLSSTPAG